MSTPKLTPEHVAHIASRAQLPVLSESDKGTVITYPLPDPKNVQGDIYLTFSRDFEKFLFFQITDAKQFVKDLAHYKPTTSYDVMHDSLRRIAEAKAAGQRAKLSQSEIAFSREGLNVLGHTDKLQDPAFDAGNTLDPTNDEPFATTLFHGVFSVAASDKDACEEGAQAIQKLFSASIKVAILEGNSRPGNERGHEHFGFQDGISQPALRGLVTPGVGQPQCDAGVIIMGYPGDPLYKAASGTARPTWTKDGSLMAFRKLKQLVPEFTKYINDAGPKWREWMPVEDVPKIQPPLSDEEGAALFGARLVGRWKSGAPIARARFRDDPTQLAKDKINNFDYVVRGAGGPSQQLCPFTAHLRKTNPRDLDPFIQKSLLESKLIVRSGTPYGPEVAPNETVTKQDRGLMFVSYQSSLENGFLTQVLNWAINDYFPAVATDFSINKWGQDGIIGGPAPAPTVVQVSAPGNKIPSGEVSLVVQNNPPDANPVIVDGFSKPDVAPVVPPQFFVTNRGGDYFFVPSVSTLKLWSQ